MEMSTEYRCMKKMVTVTWKIFLVWRSMYCLLPSASVKPEHEESRNTNSVKLNNLEKWKSKITKGRSFQLLHYQLPSYNCDRGKCSVNAGLIYKSMKGTALPCIHARVPYLSQYVYLFGYDSKRNICPTVRKWKTARTCKFHSQSRGISFRMHRIQASQ